MNYIKPKQIMENIKKNEENNLPPFECGTGWEPLILEAEALVKKYNIEHPDNECPVEFTQIKEKWGYLNLYLNYYPDDLLDKMLELSNKSKTICENCGKPTQTKEFHHWYYTLCDTCMEEVINKWKKYM